MNSNGGLEENIPLLNRGEERIDIEQEEVITKSPQAKNYLETLMDDWYDPKRENYGLVDKIKFEKIYEIAKIGLFDTICVRVIYQYIKELEEKDKAFADLENMWKLFCIDELLNLTNRVFVTEILKIIIVHWQVNETSNNSHYEHYKSIVLQARAESEKDFFNLAFLLHESLATKFENKFEEYLENNKKTFGDFYTFELIPQIRLLLVIIKNKTKKTEPHRRFRLYKVSIC